MEQNQYASDVVLGEEYRDTISGFEGTATAIVFFLNGCARVTLERWHEASGELKELTFDVPRLEHGTTGERMTTKETGGVRPTPPRQGAR